MYSWMKVFCFLWCLFSSMEEMGWVLELICLTGCEVVFPRCCLIYWIANIYMTVFAAELCIYDLAMWRRCLSIHDLYTATGNSKAENVKASGPAGRPATSNFHSWHAIFGIFIFVSASRWIQMRSCWPDSLRIYIENNFRKGGKKATGLIIFYCSKAITQLRREGALNQAI